MNITRVFPNPAVATDVTIVVPRALAAAVSCTTAGTTTITSANLFGNVLVGMAVSGIGIPAGTTVSAVASPSSLTLSQAASDSTTNVRFFGGAAINSVKNSTTTVTSSTLFGSVFVGMNVSGPGIPDGTTVAAIASQSSLTLSAAATDSLTNTLCFHYPKERWKIKSAHVKLVTDANVANRIVRLVLDDGTNTVHSSFNDAAQTATITSDYSFAPGSVGDAAAAGTSTSRVAAIPDLILNYGWRFRTVTAAKAAGDQFSEIVLCVEESGWQA